MLRFGVEMRVLDSLKKPDDAFTAGTPTCSPRSTATSSHPWSARAWVAVGEGLPGPTPVGVAVLGRPARHAVDPSGRACAAAVRVDRARVRRGVPPGVRVLHFVMSRTSILDVIVMFFALCGFAALLVDRDRSREVLAVEVGALPRGTWPVGMGPWSGAAAVLGRRCLARALRRHEVVGPVLPRRLRADVGGGTWGRVARRGWSWGIGALLKDGRTPRSRWSARRPSSTRCRGAGAQLIGYHRQWHSFHPGEGVQWLPPVLRNWVTYHQDAYTFNTTLETLHPYQSNPWSWMQTRPTSFYYESRRGVDGCTVEQCSQAINPIGTISVWWLGILALLRAVVVAGAPRLAGRGDRGGGRRGLPAVVRLPGPHDLHVLRRGLRAVGGAGGDLRDRPVRGATRGRRGAAAALARRRGYLLVTVALFAFFHPVYVADTIPYEHWRWRMWFPSWI